MVIASGKRMIVVRLASEEGSAGLVGTNFGGSRCKCSVDSSFLLY